MQRETKAFNLLLLSKTTSDVDGVLAKAQIPLKYWMNAETYPEIKFQLTASEINELKKSGSISSDNRLSLSPTATTLEKLLYSIAWKNGDLKKLKHIIEGIVDEPVDERKNGFVFHQFGRYLTKTPGEPIIDQHVLRAYGVLSDFTDQTDGKRLLTLSLITKKEKVLIDGYKMWLRTKLTSELRSEPNYSYHVDKVMFAIGRSLKDESR